MAFLEYNISTIAYCHPSTTYASIGTSKRNTKPRYYVTSSCGAGELPQSPILCVAKRIGGHNPFPLVACTLLPCERWRAGVHSKSAKLPIPQLPNISNLPPCVHPQTTSLPFSSKSKPILHCSVYMSNTNLRTYLKRIADTISLSISLPISKSMSPVY